MYSLNQELQNQSQKTTLKVKTITIYTIYLCIPLWDILLPNYFQAVFFYNAEQIPLKSKQYITCFNYLKKYLTKFIYIAYVKIISLLNDTLHAVHENFIPNKCIFIYIPSKHFPLNITLCSNLNFCISSLEEKLISLDTDLHFNIRFGTRAKNKLCIIIN